MLQRFGEIVPVPEVKFAPVDLKSVEADGTFSGYASLFGEVDLGRDVVMPGAFRDSLAVRGPRGVKLLFQHDRRRAGAEIGAAAAGAKRGAARRGAAAQVRVRILRPPR